MESVLSGRLDGRSDGLQQNGQKGFDVHLDEDGGLVVSGGGDLRVGMTVLRGISLVKMPPVVSMPRVRG